MVVGERTPGQNGENVEVGDGAEEKVEVIEVVKPPAVDVTATGYLQYVWGPENEP